MTSKHVIFAFAKVLACILAILPWVLREKLHLGLLIVESRIGASASSIERLFLLRDSLDRLISERAIALGNGVHPKHTLMGYHEFFISNIEKSSVVLDVGCGYGAVARSIGKALPSTKVIGVDNDPTRFDQIAQFDNPVNVEFIFGEAPKSVAGIQADVIVLSNVLEHIEHRVSFLKSLVSEVRPKKVLIRVPYFKREWSVAFRKEHNMSYFNDPTHFIEHDEEDFSQEMSQANLEIQDIQFIWGETWAVTTPCSG